MASRVMLLPTNLDVLADLAGDNPRWATGGVHVVSTGPKTYEVAATDCKRLLFVSGQDQVAADDMPSETLPEQSDKSEAIVPASAWKKTFQAARKLTKRCPRTRAVALSIAGNKVHMNATDMEQTTREQTLQIEGRLPPYKSVIRPAEKAICSGTVDAGGLRSTIAAMEAISAAKNDCGDTTLRFEFHGNSIQLRASNEHQEAVAIVMLCGNVDIGKDDDGTLLSEKANDLEATISRLREDRDIWKSSYESAMETIRELREAASTSTRPSSIDIAEVLKRRESGESWKSIAASLDLPETTLRGRLYRAGAIQKGQAS